MQAVYDEARLQQLKAEVEAQTLMQEIADEPHKNDRQPVAVISPIAKAETVNTPEPIMPEIVTVEIPEKVTDTLPLPEIEKVVVVEALPEPPATIIETPTTKPVIEVPEIETALYESQPEETIMAELLVEIPAAEMSFEDLVEGLEESEPVLYEQEPLFEDLDHIYNLYTQSEMPAEEAELLPLNEVAEASETIEPETEESFIAVLPEAIQEQLEEYRETAPPEEVIILKSLAVFIEGAVAELQELQEAEVIDIEKIEEVEVSIAAVYDELLQKIGIEDPVEREELVKQFIREIRAKVAEQALVEEIADLIEEDEGTHEHKRNLSVSLWSRNLSESSHQSIGRFTIRQAQAAAGRA